MAGNGLTLVVVSIHENPLDQVIAVLVARDVDKWNARTVWMSSRDDSKIAIHELDTTNLQAFLDHF